MEGFRIIGAGFTGTVEAELEDAGCDGKHGTLCWTDGHPAKLPWSFMLVKSKC